MAAGEEQVLEALEFDASEVMVEIVEMPLRALDSMHVREAQKMRRAKYTGGGLEKPLQQVVLALLRRVAVARNETNTKNAGKPKEVRLHGVQACPHGYWGVGNTLT